METIEVSKCCKAYLVEDYKTNPMDHHDSIPIFSCAKCGQECEVEIVCSFCFGAGEINIDERDSDGNWQAGVKTVPCKFCPAEIAY